jgi:hypothetical protein
MNSLHRQKNVNISESPNCPKVQPIKAQGYTYIKTVGVNVK